MEQGYSVGNAILDQQHKKLLAICAGISECVDDESVVGRAHYHEVLHELDLYARTHFLTEEALLRQHHYPKLDDQELKHQAFQDRLTELSYDATTGKFDTAGLQAFLVEWWINHILHEDVQYSDFLSRRMSGYDQLLAAR